MNQHSRNSQDHWNGQGSRHSRNGQDSRNSRQGQGPRAAPGQNRSDHRAVLIRRALAATAVVAVTVTTGCTVQTAGAGAPSPGSRAGAQAGPGGSKAPATGHKPVSAPSAAPRSASPAASSPARPPSATPSTVTPSKRAVPRPRTLMASGSGGAQVRELQARLRQTGHFDRSPTGYYGTVTAAAVADFQGGRGLAGTGSTDIVTWQRLLALTDEPTRSELRPPTTEAVAKPDPRCVEGRVLCISKNSRTLAWMIDGRVVSAMDVRLGSQYTPTREGTFKVYWKSRDHVSTLYDTPMPYAMFFSGGQAVHYSADFAARGYNGASHGCINVRDQGKIASLFSQVRNGDKVVVYG
ncbi:L,D-transpeptidase family protein [Streptomyces sp. H27-C3]|uniref:L,D-transpeptidase family protein n=1 Tax=Streptomyces sp. H27-C3 TaxID=3046305 RepID=UPI0024BBA586|nr:L,D-transpeptidase family protein [Streptomyces sp. H27-C3]MDJ0464111.1 L,D-transpeptidase family protein [Streptomyces sp. H27-C3]